MITLAARATGLAVAAALSTGLFAASPAEAVTYAKGRVVAASLTVRSAPTTHSASLRTLARGRVIEIDCKLRGPSVGANSNWYQVRGGGWVAARYVANVGKVPEYCNGEGFAIGKTTTRVAVRTGASTLDRSVGSLATGSKIKIVCKVTGPAVGGNKLWYYTEQNRWVSARYVKNVGDAPHYCHQ